MSFVERYVRADAAGGGNGTTDTNSGANGAWTLAEGITSAAAGHRVNVRAGTYANTTNARSFGTAGTTTAPVWWRGFNTTIGDCDADPTLAKPLLTFTTGLMTLAGSHQTFSSLSVQGANTGRQVSLSGTNIVIDRCRIENTNAAAGSRALSGSGVFQLTRSWLKATSTATSVLNLIVVARIHGCVFRGGGHGIDITTSGNMNIVDCVFYDNGGDGINISGAAGNAQINIAGCTFYSQGGDGVEFTAIPNYTASIVNCLFSECSGYGISNSSAANTNTILRMGNAFYLCTMGRENGMGDSPAIDEVILSADPFVNGAGADLSLASASLARAAGQPGRFEGETYLSYGDIGAIQHQDSGGGGGSSTTSAFMSRIIQSAGRVSA